MSFSRTKAIIDVVGMKAPLKSVLIVISSHADEEGGKCWPSILTISKKTGLSRSTVTRGIRALKEEHLIQVKKRRTTSGKSVNYYCLPPDIFIKDQWPNRVKELNASYANVSAHDHQEADEEEGLVQYQSAGGVTGTLQVVSQRDGGRVTGNPKHISEQTNRTQRQRSDIDNALTTLTLVNKLKEVPFDTDSECEVPDTPRRGGHHLPFDSFTKFSRFWDVYPCKQAKANAKRVWELEGCDDLVDTIVADIKKRKDNPEWTGRYVPLPQNYLRGRRWEDECSAPTRDQPNWI